MNERNFEINTKVELKWIPINSEIGAYKKTSILNGLEETIKVEEGVAYIEELENSNNLKFSTIVRNGKEYLFVMSEGSLESARSLVFKEDFPSLFGFIQEEPYTALENGEKLIVIYFNHYAGYAVKEDGQAVVMKVRFDYMGGLDNSTYDLEDALKKLKQKGGRVEPAKGDEITISDIPYYNADLNRNEHIEILYLPTQEEMHYVVENRNKKEDVLFELFDIT